ncbi:FadR/GntR family transcriptional regulator [Anaerosporobacter sp.]|uniref:FadR/GntR family transcriptional regulator n=1 Tax=Anaerosporobacter sp. TaxID=1872529 RepID=UPI00286ED101|nr:GntR family transcriptional regulator [Anaerosporobacter sp.]
MDFEKLSAPSLKELFIQQLETMILSGKLPVGEKLPPERELAHNMQVSRTVVNGGITELARKGFLTIKPRIGTFVADYRRNGTIETLISIMNYNGGILRDDEIRSILELRLGLDTLAINLCIPKITEEELSILKEKVDFLKTAHTPEEASIIAFEFQHELACLSGNTLMPLIFSSFRIPVTTLWERFCRLYGIEALHNNTLTLFQHIEAKDTQKALNWLTTSINDTIQGNRPIYY